nr:hypothetical protein CFP56_32786 [Quercus suber]POF25802.1 hypothetical protein CFP56_66625 [Quercus suber]
MSGYKGMKYGPNQVGTSKSTWAATPHHARYNLDQVEKGKNGWPKAQPPARRRPIPEYSMSSENDRVSTAQLAGSKNRLSFISGPSTEPSSSATFEFKTLARDERGHTIGKGSDCDTGGCYLKDLGKSHACNGKLQAQVQGSLEINFLANEENAEIGIFAMDGHTMRNVNGDIEEEQMESKEGGGALTSA